MTENATCRTEQATKFFMQGVFVLNSGMAWKMNKIYHKSSNVTGARLPKQYSH